MGIFSECLAKGKTGEQLWAQILKNIGAEDIEFNDDGRYDISCLLNGKTVTYEVKTDFNTIRTQNVAVEFSSRGRKSGIITSNAKYWVYLIDRAFYLIDAQKLKKYVLNRDMELDIKTSVDGNLIYLIPLGDFKKITVFVTSDAHQEITKNKVGISWY